jgi:hypothetical protein
MTIFRLSLFLILWCVVPCVLSAPYPNCTLSDWLLDHHLSRESYYLSSEIDRMSRETERKIQRMYSDLSYGLEHSCYSYYDTSAFKDALDWDIRVNMVNSAMWMWSRVVFNSTDPPTRRLLICTPSRRLLRLSRH